MNFSGFFSSDSKLCDFGKKKNLKKVQLLVFCSCHWDNRRWYWLPLCFRIEFKILLITFKAPHGLSPCCISDLYDPTSQYVLWDPQAEVVVFLSTPEARLKTKRTICQRKSGWLSQWFLLILFLKHTLIREPPLILLEF